MKNIKLEIFNFRKSLSIEQEEVSNILEAYLGSLNDISEKQTVTSGKTSAIVSSPSRSLAAIAAGKIL